MDPEFRAAYQAGLTKVVAEMGKDMGVAMLHGSQPRRLVLWLGVGQKCPICCGYGSDNGGPSPWSCRTCAGTGRLRFPKVYRLRKYAPYPKTHPYAGTPKERTGWAGDSE